MANLRPQRSSLRSAADPRFVRLVKESADGKPDEEAAGVLAMNEDHGFCAKTFPNELRERVLQYLDRRMRSERASLETNRYYSFADTWRQPIEDSHVRQAEAEFLRELASSRPFAGLLQKHRPTSIDDAYETIERHIRRRLRSYGFSGSREEDDNEPIW